MNVARGIASTLGLATIVASTACATAYTPTSNRMAIRVNPGDSVTVVEGGAELDNVTLEARFEAEPETAKEFEAYRSKRRAGLVMRVIGGIGAVTGSAVAGYDIGKNSRAGQAPTEVALAGGLISLGCLAIVVGGAYLEAGSRTNLANAVNLYNDGEEERERRKRLATPPPLAPFKPQAPPAPARPAPSPTPPPSAAPLESAPPTAPVEAPP